MAHNRIDTLNELGDDALRIIDALELPDKLYEHGKTKVYLINLKKQQLEIIEIGDCE